MASSSCVHLMNVGIHPHHQHNTFRNPKPMLTSPTYVRVNLRASCSSPNSLLIAGQKHKLQFVSPKTLQHPNVFPSRRSTICTATFFGENTSSLENTPKIPATEICTLVLVYIIPFLNRLNLLSKFPVLKCVMPLVGFYQSIPTLGSIVFLALFIVFVRYRNYTKFNNYSVQAMVMDVVVVAASLVRPFLVNPVPLSGGAVGFKFQLLHVLELLSFQICVHSCLEYLGAVQWVGEEDTLTHLMKVVLKTEDNEGRLVGKSLVLKYIRGQDNLLGDLTSTETCNKFILSSCQSCLNSLLHLFKKGAKENTYEIAEQISLEVDNLLWLLDILEDRQVAEEFALMWANQQKLASLHKKVWLSTRYLVSCITARLFAGLRNGKILLDKDTRQLLLQTWFQPLVDDYLRLKKLKSFDPKKLEENIEVGILDLALLGATPKELGATLKKTKKVTQT